MHILFIHQNYPAQFGHMGPSLLSSAVSRGFFDAIGNCMQLCWQLIDMATEV